ncbi:MAG TPA: ribulose phosphate epimerase [Gammaproteobacteria bacterium]|nr:ribulose phosphate epimerase [Gammaproteobacteria bacterium]
MRHPITPAVRRDSPELHMDSREKLLEELRNGYRIFAAHGWGDLGDGHISARDPDRTDCFWLLRYGVPFAEVETSDFVLLNADGRTVEGSGDVNQAGFFIPQPLLAARRDIVSAAHTHTQWGTPFSAEVRNVEPITQEACLFFEDCVVFDDEEVQIQSLDGGSRIAQSLGRNGAIVLRNHGLLTVGTTVAQSVSRFVMLERVAEAHLKARNAKPISGESARRAKQDLTREGADRSAFEFLVNHHIKD